MRGGEGRRQTQTDGCSFSTDIQEKTWFRSHLTFMAAFAALYFRALNEFVSTFPENESRCGAL